MSKSADAAHTLLTEVARIRADATARLDAIADAAGVEALRVEVLGRSGTLTALLRGLSGIPAADRPAAGAQANEARRDLEGAFAARLEALAGGELGQRLVTEALDMTAPGRSVRVGHLHP